jgi:arginyl-tRNA--protein-N-Asp/Glu arginylyltransferase
MQIIENKNKLIYYMQKYRRNCSSCTNCCSVRILSDGYKKVNNVLRLLVVQSLIF